MTNFEKMKKELTIEKYAKGLRGDRSCWFCPHLHNSTICSDYDNAETCTKLYTEWANKEVEEVADANLTEIKVGDKLKIKQGLKIGETYDRNEHNHYMGCRYRRGMKIAGEIVTILDIIDKGRFSVVEDGWTYSSEMLEPVAAEPVAEPAEEPTAFMVGDIVRIREGLKDLEEYGDYSYLSIMLKCGSEHIVTEIRNGGNYSLSECKYKLSYSPQMLELVKRGEPVEEPTKPQEPQDLRELLLTGRSITTRDGSRYRIFRDIPESNHNIIGVYFDKARYNDFETNNPDLTYNPNSSHDIMTINERPSPKDLLTDKEGEILWQREEKPWKPKVGEEYWYIHQDQDAYQIGLQNCSTINWFNMQNNNIYQTKAQAEADKPRMLAIYEKIKREYEGENE